jgi:hypothetical protein
MSIMRLPLFHPFVLPCLASLLLATSTPGCRNDEPGSPPESSPSSTTARTDALAATAVELKAAIREADRDQRGTVSVTEARELPGYSFAVRHFILRRVTNPKENVAVSTLTLWVDDAVARLVLRAKEGQVSATEAATGDMAERALYAIATGRTAHAPSVTAADIEAAVIRLRKKFDAIAAKSPQPGIVDRAAVLGMAPEDLTPTERDFFLDMIEASFGPSVKPELDAYRYDSFVQGAQTTLLSATRSGPRRESVSAKDALELLVVPRDLWAVAAETR